MNNVKTFISAVLSNRDKYVWYCSCIAFFTFRSHETPEFLRSTITSQFSIPHHLYRLHRLYFTNICTHNLQIWSLEIVYVDLMIIKKMKRKMFFVEEIELSLKVFLILFFYLFEPNNFH